jgi:hypothetical protein
MIRTTGLENISIMETALSLKETGSMTHRLARAESPGQTDRHFKVSI